MLLSVIIPMYNAENYIRRCVESLYQQNIIDSDFEVIIIKDGSIDQSYQQACILSKEHANIILIDKENEGQSVARNIGISRAQGDYLIFVDSDDYLQSGQMAEAIKKCQEEQLDIYMMQMKVMRPDGSLPTELRTWNFSEEEVFSGEYLLLHGYYPSSVCAKIFNRSFVEHSNIRFIKGIIHEDSDFCWKLCALAGRIMFSNVWAYTYYYNSQSTDRKINREKLMKSAFSNVVICSDLYTFSQSRHISVALSIFFQKLVNSMYLSEFYKLACNKDISFNDFIQFVKESKRYKVLPLHGCCKSGKARLGKISINILSLLF